MKKLIVLSFTALLLLIFAACAAAESAGAGDAAQGAGGPAAVAGDGERTRADTVTFAQSGDITSLDPHIGNQLRATVVTTQIFDTLVELSEDMEIQSRLAESWERLSDSSMKFHLRRGVTFHNGDPFNAYDVQFSIERAMASPQVTRNVAWIHSVEVVDEYTVIVNADGRY